jgi:hypothetical protein
VGMAKGVRLGASLTACWGSEVAFPKMWTD